MFPHPDPETIHGLNRHRWLAAMGRAYWRHREPKYLEGMWREWDFYVAKVPFPDEAFYRRISAFPPNALVPPYGEPDFPFQTLQTMVEYRLLIAWHSLFVVNIRKQLAVFAVILWKTE